jgi:hypothetical protein
VRIVTIFLVLFLSFAFTAIAAESTVNCHCFTDRSYDHQNPRKVIPYLLATTQNSFLSVAFNTPKFNLVKDLMAGVPSEQLWISHYFADRFNVDSKALLLTHQTKGSWRGAIQAAGFSEGGLPPSFVAAMQAANDHMLAAAVVDDTLLNLMKVDADQLKRMRTTGADNREVILCFFLAKRTDQQATEVFKSVTSGTTNWGTLAFIGNVQIGKMEQEFKALLNRE